MARSFSVAVDSSGHLGDAQVCFREVILGRLIDFAKGVRTATINTTRLQTLGLWTLGLLLLVRIT